MKTFLASVAAIGLMSGAAFAAGTTQDSTAGSGSTAGTASGTSTGATGGTTAAAATGAASGEAQAVIKTTESEEYGEYLTDAEGRAVYVLEADQQAEGAAEASACEAECAEVWPPVLAGDMPPQAEGAADEGMLSMTERADGTSQVTYDGKPLYYYEKDEGMGEATGQDVHDEWGEWYLLQPSGETVEE